MGNHLFKLFCGSASLELGKKIANAYGCSLGDVDITRFSDGEIQPCIRLSIRGDDVFVIQSTFSPAENILELLLIIDAIRRSSASTINVVIPYFGYARQDRKDRPRVSLGAKMIANLLTAAGANRVITMDLHAGQIQGFFDIPLDNLDASSVFIPYYQSQNIPDLTIASPDMGGVVRARKYAKYLQASLILVDKHREQANQVSSMQIIGDVKNRNVIIVDDIVDTAGTLCKAADHIMKCGATSVRAAITHPLLSGNAYERIGQSSLTELLVTDTIPLRSSHKKIKVLSIAPIFARALEKIYHQESVSSLFLS